jgi:hypothetical protein
VGRTLKVVGVLSAAAVLGLWLGFMWGAVDRVHERAPSPEVSAPPAVITEP